MSMKNPLIPAGIEPAINLRKKYISNVTLSLQKLKCGGRKIKSENCKNYVRKLKHVDPALGKRNACLCRQ
jgi:hypothetical protein